MRFFPEDPKKLKAMISRYKRRLIQEGKQTGYISDGSGHRYSIGPLYMILGDWEAALESFRWFDETFPEDIGEPGHSLCWALCLHREGLKVEAENKLMETAFKNLYVIPHLIGEDIEPLDIWHGSNSARKDYLDDIPEEFWDLWTGDAIEFAREYWPRKETEAVVAEYIDLAHLLLSLPGGSDERIAVVRNMSAIENRYREKQTF